MSAGRWVAPRPLPDILSPNSSPGRVTRAPSGRHRLEPAHTQASLPCDFGLSPIPSLGVEQMWMCRISFLRTSERRGEGLVMRAIVALVEHYLREWDSSG